jgi:predicted amidohydrolase
MKIALIQQVATLDLAKNVQRGLDAAREAAANGADLIVFPELAFTPFYPQHRLTGSRFDLTETIPGPTTNLFSDLAAELNVVFVLNLFEQQGDAAYDSSPVIDADGSILGVTRMIHITQYEGFYEQDYYDPGDTGAPVYETAVGRVGVAICYDRHYPEYMHALGRKRADIVVIPQAGSQGEWPEGVFEAEVQASAFQNGYFAALANRVGAEEILTFAGGSFVVDPRGQVLNKAQEGKELILYQELDLSEVQSSPARTLFFEHARPDLILR